VVPANEPWKRAKTPEGEAELKRRIETKLKRFRPLTPSLRHTVLLDRSELWKGRPVPELTEGLRKHGGRGRLGHVTVRGRGGGHKRLYRLIDFKRSIHDVAGVVQRLEYDPNRNGYIALMKYPDDRVCYILAPDKLAPGDSIVASRTKEVEIRVGNAGCLSTMPIGTRVHNVEIQPGHGGQIARGAGTYCELLDKVSRPGYVLLRLGSKEQRFILETCLATIGQVSCPQHKLRVLGKAGRKRWLGRKPKVRGVAKNPVDHPHGGGAGKTKGGRTSTNETGRVKKGLRTREHGKLSKRVILYNRKGELPK